MNLMQEGRIFVEDPTFELSEGGRRVKAELFT
jgi:hypothetical protein